ncbi:hypothetical protein DZB84_03695 [Bacillus sp. HNG]|uniref:DUF6376 family protein n=1 Tax=Bacillus sp. HNG TaxID=2293325 RepID=UPI000E2FB974|nr:DUF6376 family protein [Bacillus sp. HNG]RFB18026.1 hypothetical protein DZB84_03695 [Bacillus sp. HNG]
MKKGFIVFSLLGLLFLGACSVLEDVNNTVTYVNEATDYVNEVSTFINEAPTLAEQAVTDEQARDDLETRLTEIQADMVAFNELQPPEMAADLHQQIVDYNQQAEEGITLYLDNIESGQIDPALFENSEVFQTLQNVTNTIDQIKNLGE